jgi:preprotein translocase subunit SecG
MSVVFFLTCLSLAVLSVRQSKSLMSGANRQAKPAAKTEAVKTGDVKAEPVKAEAAKTEAVKAAAPVEQAKPEAGK